MSIAFGFSTLTMMKTYWTAMARTRPAARRPGPEQHISVPGRCPPAAAAARRDTGVSGRGLAMWRGVMRRGARTDARDGVVEQEGAEQHEVEAEEDEEGVTGNGLVRWILRVQVDSQGQQGAEEEQIFHNPDHVGQFAFLEKGARAGWSDACAPARCSAHRSRARRHEAEHLLHVHRTHEGDANAGQRGSHHACGHDLGRRHRGQNRGCERGQGPSGAGREGGPE